MRRPSKTFDRVSISVLSSRSPALSSLSPAHILPHRNYNRKSRQTSRFVGLLYIPVRENQDTVIQTVNLTNVYI